MHLHFEIETLGWISCLITSGKGDEILVRHSSDYGDKFQELINDLFIIREHLLETNSYYLYTGGSGIKWCDDISEFEWRFSSAATGEYLKLELIETSAEAEAYPESESATYRKVLVQEEIKLSVLFNNIYISLDKMFKEFGFIGYKKKWEVGNFPMAEYIELKAAFLDIKLQKEAFNEETEWKEKVLLSQELEILQQEYIIGEG